MDVRHLLTDTVVREPRTGQAARSLPVYGPQQTLPARELERTDALQSEGADGTQATLTVKLMMLDQVGLHDRVWPPGADAQDVEAARFPKSVTPVKTLSGALAYWEVVL